MNDKFGISAKIASSFTKNSNRIFAIFGLNGKKLLSLNFFDQHTML